MIRVAVVEDAQPDRERLIALINDWKLAHDKTIVTDTYSDAVSFLEQGAQSADIIFMDIRMPNLSGMEAAEKLRKVNTYSVLIFLTSLAGYAIKGYAVDAMDFILKPIQPERFANAFERAIRICERKKRYITIYAKDQVLRVNPDEILYIEAFAHTKIYHVGTQAYSVSEDMEHLLSNLPPEFVRCHRSYIVNLKNIESVGKDFVKLAHCGTVIPVSRSRHDELVEALMRCYTTTSGGEFDAEYTFQSGQ